MINKHTTARFIRLVTKNNSRIEIERELKALYPRLWRYCLTMTGNRDDANDLAQAAVLRALEKSHQYQPGTRVDSWIFTIAQRTWLNELRSKAVRRGGGITPIEEIELPDQNPTPEMNIYYREVLNKVLDLPEAQRSTVLLVYVEGYSYKEASSILEIPIGTIMSRLAAARSKLMENLTDDESGVG